MSESESKFVRVWRSVAATLVAGAIEERRAALKPGDVITDPSLLCEGMRVKWSPQRGDISPPTWRLGRRCENGWNICNASEFPGPYYRDHDVGDVGVVYLGMAVPDKLCNEVQCDFHGIAHECVRAKHRRPTAHDFSDPYAVCVIRPGGEKVIARVCVRCGRDKDDGGGCRARDWRAEDDRLTAQLTFAAEPAQLPVIVERQTHEPSPTGLGGLAGRYRVNRR